MKRIITKTALSVCVFFTITMLVSTIMGYVFAGPSYGLNITVSIFAATATLAVLQALWFTETVVKHLAYPLRIVGFGLSAFPPLAVCAWLSQWLPADIPGVWISFAVTYLIILAGATAAYTAYYRKVAGSYDEALKRYHNPKAQ